MDYNYTSTPAGDPVTLAEAKAQLRVLHSSEDPLIGRLISVASRHIEQRISRTLIKQTLTFQRDGFPVRGGAITLPRPPVMSVSSVAYFDHIGSEQTLDTSFYQLLKSPVECELVPATKSWPMTSRARRNVTIVYVGGYGDDPTAVPEDIRNAVLMMVQHLYDHRSAVTEVRTSTVIVTPMAVDALLEPYMTSGWI